MPAVKNHSSVLARPFLQSFANVEDPQAKGAFVGAISHANTEYRTPLELQEALDLSPGPNSPYIKRSPELVSYAAGLTKIQVPDQLNLKEASSLFEVWMKDKVLVGCKLSLSTCYSTFNTVFSSK
jgi:hypothetical protein